MHVVYDHKELFDNVPRADFASESGNIVIYGAGFYGLLAAFLLKKQNISVICFADRNPDKRKQSFFGLPVISPEEMYEKYSKSLIIVTPYVLEAIFHKFVEDGLRVVTPYSLFLDFDSEGFDNLPDIPSWYDPDSLDFNVYMFLRRCNNLLGSRPLAAIDVSVTQKCNLRCKECTSFMPYYSHPQDFELDDVINYCDKVLKNRLFHQFFLEGGEPFLWKPLAKLLEYLVKREEIFTIMIATNGTILPSPELLEVLKNPKIMVRISDYGEHSRKKDAMLDLFKKENVICKTIRVNWNKITDFYLRPEEEYKEIISSCCKLEDNGTPNIADGLMFVCPIQANLHNAGIFVSPPEDYIDLHEPDSEEMQKRIGEFLQAKHIPKVCRYCNGRGYTGEKVPPAEQLAPGEKMEIVFRK